MADTPQAVKYVGIGNISEVWNSITYDLSMLLMKFVNMLTRQLTSPRS